MILELSYAILYIWAIVASLWANSQVKKFLASTPAIRDTVDLERFKDLARKNMYMALVQMLVLGLGLLVGVVILWRHGAVGFFAVIATNLVVFGFGHVLGKHEKQARNLSARFEELGLEHQRIGETWVKKPFPDF